MSSATFEITEHDAQGRLIATISGIGRNRGTWDTTCRSKRTANRWLREMRAAHPGRVFSIYPASDRTASSLPRTQTYMSTTTARIMTSRFPGTCVGCKGRIQRGEEIRHEGPGLAYHVRCESNGSTPAPERTRIITTRFSGGGTHYRNSRGRCEDAPCCGCCS